MRVFLIFCIHSDCWQRWMTVKCWQIYGKSKYLTAFFFKLFLDFLFLPGGNIRACDAIRHTFIDGFFDVICSVIALKVVGAHPLSRSIFNSIAIFLICEAHSGYDFPWSAHNILTFFAGPVIHRKHHHNGSCNFSKFFIWCDMLFGTLSN